MRNLAIQEGKKRGEIVAYFWSPVDARMALRKPAILASTWAFEGERFSSMQSPEKYVRTNSADTVAFLRGMTAARFSMRDLRIASLCSSIKVRARFGRVATSRIELTEVHAEFDGDAVLPPLEGEWEETFREGHQTEDGLAYSFVTLERVTE